MDTIKIISIILLTIIFIFYSARIDAEHINKEEYIINHIDRWFQRCCFFIALGSIHPFCILASGLLFTSLFDQILNKLRNKDLLYLGTVSGWDRFFREKKILYIIVKIITLVLSVFLFIITSND